MQPQPPYIQITDSGVSILHQRPPGARTIPPSGDPMVVAVYRDLTLELCGNGFSVKTCLTPDGVCALIGLLNFALRDHLHAKQVH